MTNIHICVLWYIYISGWNRAVLNINLLMIDGVLNHVEVIACNIIAVFFCKNEKFGFIN